jgi:hypothetical protein
MRRLTEAAAVLALAVAPSASGDDLLEMVFSGHIADIYEYGTLSEPFVSWRIGEPYEMRIIVDPRSTGAGFEWTVRSASITAAGQVHQAPSVANPYAVFERHPGSEWDELGWYVYLMSDQWDGAIFISGFAWFPVGATQNLATLDCTTLEELFSQMTFSNGGVSRPDDESASGPYQLSACFIPCDLRNCPADFNCDGGVDGADVQAFFSSWEAGGSAADVDHNGGVDGSDVQSFFTLWEQGAC